MYHLSVDCGLHIPTINMGTGIIIIGQIDFSDSIAERCPKEVAFSG